jgi:ubiquinone/menaquinone biosynthesis C-methylase UbiE
MKPVGRRQSPVQRWLVRSARRRPSAVLPVHFANLLQGIQGRVVEVGCGEGALFPHYPGTVDELLAVEPNAWARRAAASVASHLGFSAQVLDSDVAGGLPASISSVDVVVCCEALCSVAEPDRMLAEIRRILRPGGELRIYEHVLATSRIGRIIQRMVDRLGWPKLLGGCHASRDTTRMISEAGFEWVSLRRVWYARKLILWLVGPHIIGRARAPDPCRRSS